MSARPIVLCKLKKGQLIDSQENFVDTFNWMVDFINNLRGANGIEVKNPLTDFPIIQPNKKDEGTMVLQCVNESGDVTSAQKVKSIRFVSGSNSNESFRVYDDGKGNATVYLDTYWK